MKTDRRTFLRQVGCALSGTFALGVGEIPIGRNTNTTKETGRSATVEEGVWDSTRFIVTDNDMGRMFGQDELDAVKFRANGAGPIKKITLDGVEYYVVYNQHLTDEYREYLYKKYG